ncbi:hypothetical protein BDY19DRAFT_905906 [Irpex rosettiformis]|uniref:Uncharacterized protein n=1 Tax=Irpex rosettiformis TaxID=378272 RepID=A0ACB8U5R0_9APHY|nr:hypothetical protein BDY19DRAFT_905906 [Irpex rosettiformis]
MSAMGISPILATSSHPAVSTVERTASYDWETYFYIIAQLVGGMGLSVLLVTLVWSSSKRRPRNPLLISLCFSWWLSTFPCLCILYYANQVVGPPPSPAVCLASASLTMAQSVMVAFTGPALILHVWLVVRAAISRRFVEDIWVRRTAVICIILPYMLFIITALSALWVGLKEPHLVYRVKFYCVVEGHILTKAVSACGLFFVGSAIILEALTVAMLYRHRIIVRHLSREGYGLDFPLVLRVCVFGLYVVLGLCLEIQSLFHWTNPISDLFFSTFSIAVFIVFGTQPETWQIWRQAYRRFGGTLSQISVPYQLQPRPYLLPMISSSSPSSRNHLTVTPGHSQRQSSSFHLPRPYSRESEPVLSIQSRAQSYDYERQPFCHPPPPAPLPVARHSVRWTRDCEVMTATSPPAHTNDNPRTPTSPSFPNPGFPHPDHLRKPSKKGWKPSGYSLGLDLAQPPRVDGLAFDAAMLDVQSIQPTDDILVLTDPAAPARSGRETPQKL